MLKGMRWIVPKNVTTIHGASLSLRNIHEYVEVSAQSQGETTSRVLNEQIWGGNWILNQPSRWTEGEAIELEWRLPPSVYPTRLRSDPAYYWRLDVKASLPGTDFLATYLIPVYS